MTNNAKLRKYANLEGTELSEYCQALLGIAYIPESYGKSTEVAEAVDKEVARLLQYFEDNCTIETEVITPESYNDETLIWNNE